MLKDQLLKTSGLQFDNWLFQPEMFSGHSEKLGALDSLGPCTPFITVTKSPVKLFLGWEWVVTRMDTPKYGETLKFMYIKYQPILVVLSKVYPI